MSGTGVEFRGSVLRDIGLLILPVLLGFASLVRARRETDLSQPNLSLLLGVVLLSVTALLAIKMLGGRPFLKINGEGIEWGRGSRTKKLLWAQCDSFDATTSGPGMPEMITVTYNSNYLEGGGKLGIEGRLNAPTEEIIHVLNKWHERSSAA